MITKRVKDKKNFHKHLKSKIFDMTTYLNHHKKEFKEAFLPNILIINYKEWLFSEHHVILKYERIDGEDEVCVENYIFDEWLMDIQSN